jgi:hypothetical protein
VKNGSDDTKEVKLLRSGETDDFKRVLGTSLEIHPFGKVLTCLEQTPLFQVINAINFSPAFIQVLVIGCITVKQQSV